MLVLEKIREYAKTGRTALVNRDERMTFAELDARSEAFAAWLLGRFGNDRAPVVICGEKESNFLPCILGALKSGRSYVPIDSIIPFQRADEILAAVKPSVIVNFTDLPLETSGEVLDAKTTEILLQTCPREPLPETYWVSGDEAAYILFTSGSTGKPKGVPITARNLDFFCKGLLPWYWEKGGVILHQVSYSFDVSGCAVYAGLSNGMTLFTIDRRMMENYRELFELLRGSNLTMWVSTPSFAEVCVRSGVFDAGLLPSLEQFLFCGEVLTHALCDTLAERFPAARIVNTYGPTEATVLVTAVEITEKMRRESRPIPIGAPIAGTMLRLADAQGQEIYGDEQTGELLILGESVGPGYLGRPEFTQKSFFTEPACGLRGYRTGDLCYRVGQLYYYSGRADNQLKLSGFRVELEDIEQNLQRLPNVVRAVVLPVYNAKKADHLAAFLLLREPDGLTALKRAIQIKRQAANYLPVYMIPRKIFTVDAFPLNVNGKIDRQELARRLREGMV